MMSDDTETAMIRAAERLVDALGGQAETARICGVRRQYIWRWCNPPPHGTGGHIPIRHLATIRAAARVRDLTSVDRQIDRYLEAITGKRRRRNQKV